MNTARDQIHKPSIAYWRDHSAGASRRRVTPIPQGNRPSTAACTRLGARKASDIVILTCRRLHLSRAAICSTVVTVRATISASQCRALATGTLSPAVKHGRRDVIAILDASLADMARAHAVATVVIDATDQQGFGLVACHRVIVALLVELGLHRVKEVTIEDGGLLARKHLAFEHNLADIESIAQKMGKRTSAERDPAN